MQEPGPAVRPDRGSDQLDMRSSERIRLGERQLAESDELGETVHIGSVPVC